MRYTIIVEILERVKKKCLPSAEKALAQNSGILKITDPGILWRVDDFI